MSDVLGPATDPRAANYTIEGVRRSASGGPCGGERYDWSATLFLVRTWSPTRSAGSPA